MPIFLPDNPLLRRNCLLQQIIEGKIKGQIEVSRRRGRRRNKLLGNLKDRRGYCQLKEEALDRTMWRNRFGRGFGPVVWQITDNDDEPTCSMNYELIYQLNAIEYLLCTFSSTYFGLTRPPSRAMDVKFLYICSMWWSLV